MVSRRELCLFVVGLACVPTTPAQAETWRTYQNDRYGTTVEFPDRFRPRQPSENGEGLSFESADGARLLVFAGRNVLDQDLRALQTAIMDSREIGETYTNRNSGPNWFILAGTRGTVDFYERRMLSHGGKIINNFVMTYPSRLRRVYEPIVTRMSRSFRAGRGESTTGVP
jgi:hypothetical protein